LKFTLIKYLFLLGMAANILQILLQLISRIHFLVNGGYNFNFALFHSFDLNFFVDPNNELHIMLFK